MTATDAPPPTPEPPPLRSVHTTNFGPLLGELGLPILVTTYQAGKLVVLRRDDQGTLNTHFSSPQPRCQSYLLSTRGPRGRPAWCRRPRGP